MNANVSEIWSYYTKQKCFYGWLGSVGRTQKQTLILSLEFKIMFWIIRLAQKYFVFVEYTIHLFAAFLNAITLSQEISILQFYSCHQQCPIVQPHLPHTPRDTLLHQRVLQNSIFLGTVSANPTFYVPVRCHFCLPTAPKYINSNPNFWIIWV